MSNIIFLDIDGVLNTLTTCNLPPSFEKEVRFEAWLNPVSINLVNKLASECSGEIVLSSSWRLLDKKFHTDPVLSDEDLRKFDVRKFLAKSGLTANFHSDWHTPKPQRFGELINGRARGFEVKDWLENNPEVKNWVALDDDISGFYEEYRQRLVRTNPRMGFLEEDYENAKDILAGNLPAYIEYEDWHR